MKNIIIKSLENNNRFELAIEGEVTVRDALYREEVLDFFDSEAEDVIDNFEEFNGAEVSDAIRKIVLDSAVDDGIVLGVSLEGYEPEVEEDDDEATEESRPEGGIVIVSTSGGMLDIPVVTTAGQTVADAIKAEVVATRSGQTLAQLTSCAVMLNGASISWETAEARRVHQDDRIVLSPVAAGTKGC